MLKLTSKHNSFIENFCNPASETFNNRIKSMIKAGYSINYARHRSRYLLENSLIGEAIRAYKDRMVEKQLITIELQQNKHARLAKLAEAKGDFATATRNEELIGRTIGAYVDRSQTEQLPGQKKLSDKEEAEAQRIANIRLRDKTG